MDAAIVLNAMGVFPKNSPLIPVCAKNPREVRGVFHSSRVAIFGRPECIQTDVGDSWSELALASLKEKWDCAWHLRKISGG